MSVKTILIAHRQASVRDRFAAALADARHAFVLADTEAAVFETFGAKQEPISLVLVDLGLADNGVAFVQALRRSAGRALPIVVFAGTVSSATEVPALLAMHIAGYVNEHAAIPQILPALAPHLFPDNFNRRTSLRVALGVPVSYRVGQTIAGAVTLDVGKSGVAIRTMNPLPLGTPIQIRFRLPGTVTDIDAGGRIAWSDRKVGMGVQFEQLSAGDQATIDAFIEGQMG
jgi:ActR/RegA family two-component response regulator